MTKQEKAVECKVCHNIHTQEAIDEMNNARYDLIVAQLDNFKETGCPDWPVKSIGSESK